MPSLGSEYGLIECGSPDYPPRTAKNVFFSDATVRFAADWNSPGELCTFHVIKRYKKPHIEIDINCLKQNGFPSQQVILDAQSVYNKGDGFIDCKAIIFIEFIKWLVLNQVKILNVAGNSDRTSPGITSIVESFLVKALGEAQP